LGRAEVLHKRVPDAQLYSQISSRTGAFATPGQKTFRTRLSAEKSAKSRFPEDLRPDNKSPTIGPGEPAPSADTVEKLAPVWSSGHGSVIERTNLDTELSRISEGTGAASSRNRNIARYLASVT
jgi:hypothetical protein